MSNGHGGEGSEGIEGTEARGTEAMVGGAGGTDAGTEGAGAGGSSMCSATGAGPLVEYQQPAGPWLVLEGEDERHEVWPTTDRQVRVASQPRRPSNRGSAGKPMCSSTWHRSRGNRRGVDSARADSDGGPYPRSGIRPS